MQKYYQGINPKMRQDYLWVIQAGFVKEAECQYGQAMA
jgi:hypothetical protein